MPVTPLHFGPALAVRELVGHQRFGIWAFTATQVMFDTEPIVRILFDLEGKLHETTHNPLFGLIFALVAIALCWKWEKWAGIVGAVFGSVTHLWLDVMYHADVAEAIARWGDTFTMRENATPFNAELICYIGFFFWLLFWGIRHSINARKAASQGVTELDQTLSVQQHEQQPLPGRHHAGA